MKEMILDAIIENIDPLTDFINAELEAVECPMKTQLQIDVAIDEIFTNISDYAYSAGKGKATVRFEYDPDSYSVLITFIDSGTPFNPLLVEEPDTTLSADERRIGGLGIFLVKKTMDDLQYEFKDGKNILRIRKRIF